jgi:hypothetical protein
LPLRAAQAPQPAVVAQRMRAGLARPPAYHGLPRPRPLPPQLIGVMAGFKYGVTRWLILHTNMAVAWLFNTTTSLALVAASSAAAVHYAPAAIGSGVPEVMAYLNGVMMPKVGGGGAVGAERQCACCAHPAKGPRPRPAAPLTRPPAPRRPPPPSTPRQVFNIATVCVKVVSCGLAVASGLPVGPEGPLIHIGAALGAALSQGHSTTLGFTTNAFRRFRNPKDKRDFVTAGVAAGVAVAFNAPIGGLLFAFEEVASFWQHSLGWQIFFACTCATLTLNLLRSAGKALLHSGVFGWFNEDVVFEAGLEVSAHVLAVIPAAAVGALAGVAGALFTMTNLRVCRARDARMAGAKWRRCVEPCVLVVVYVTGTMVLPLFFPCTPTQCVTHRGEVYCDVPTRGGPGGGGPPGSWPPSPGDSGGGNGTGPAGLGPGAQPLSLPLYTCSVRPGGGGGGGGGGSGDDRSWIPDSGTITPDSPSANGTTTVYYNELATLLLNTGEGGVGGGCSRAWGFLRTCLALGLARGAAGLARGRRRARPPPAAPLGRRRRHQAPLLARRAPALPLRPAAHHVCVVLPRRRAGGGLRLLHRPVRAHDHDGRLPRPHRGARDDRDREQAPCGCGARRARGGRGAARRGAWPWGGRGLAGSAAKSAPPHA